jgi:hypothetical protein
MTIFVAVNTHTAGATMWQQHTIAYLKYVASVFQLGVGINRSAKYDVRLVAMLWRQLV